MPHSLAAFLPLLIIIAVLALRMRRIGKPFRVRTWSLLILPVLLTVFIGLSLWSIWFGLSHSPNGINMGQGRVTMPPLSMVLLCAILSLLGGGAYGVWRGHALKLWFDDAQNAVMAQSSRLMMVVLIGLIVVRTGMRFLFTSTEAGLYFQISAMLFGMALVNGYYITLWLRQKALRAGHPAY